MSVYDVNGNIIDSGGGTASAIDYDMIIKSVAHRGYSSAAPENTLPAYKFAKKMGFKFVECDICWTSDNIPVLSHDLTIDRCSNGSGTISNMTLSQLRQYDFGSWKSSAYAGTTIPTFEEFIELCRNIGLYPYLDPRSNNSSKLELVVDIYTAYGMKDHITWIGGSDIGSAIKTLDDTARIGMFATNTITSSTITTAQGLLTGKNEVFLDADYNYATAEACALCASGGLPVEIWTVGRTQILAMNPYVTGITSNDQIAGKILYDANIA